MAVDEEENYNNEERKLKRRRLLEYSSSSSNYTRCHSNIIRQIDCIETEKVIYSVLEFCQGVELVDYLNACGGMSDDEARNVMRQLLSGLSYLHSLGIVHRDLSLENILIAENQQAAIIIDFGAAVKLIPRPDYKDNCGKQQLYRSDSVGTMDLKSHHQHFCWLKNSTAGLYCRLYGKCCFIASELWNDEEYFHPILCEIWTIGMILFMMLTNSRPFERAAISEEAYVALETNGLEYLLMCFGMELDPLAIDLIEKIWNPNPLERLTIEEILQHPWMHAT